LGIENRWRPNEPNDVGGNHGSPEPSILLSVSPAFGLESVRARSVEEHQGQPRWAVARGQSTWTGDSGEMNLGFAADMEQQAD